MLHPKFELGLDQASKLSLKMMPVTGAPAKPIVALNSELLPSRSMVIAVSPPEDRASRTVLTPSDALESDFSASACHPVGENAL